MKRITIGEILKATGGKLVSGNENNFINDIKQDSRICADGDMFVAIKGENHDGHAYVKGVLDAGCKTVFISDETCLPEDLSADVNAILVEDTVYSLGDLAGWYLDTLNVRKVAVTGSVGKTSVRDMIYYVLSEKYSTGRNMKNFNNDIGLPLSIFQFDENTEAVVLEMGMNHFGEIDRLASIVKPEIGVITNIGVAHVENQGSREGIYQAKMEIASHIQQGGKLVYVADGEYLTKERTAGDYTQISIGTNGKSDYIITSVDDFGLEGIQFLVENNQVNHKILLPLPGIHNAYNAGVALAVGNLLGISIEEGAAGLAKAELTGRRLKVVKGKRASVIDDTYNASTDSMKSALKVLENSKCEGKRIAVLGDMFELGEESEKQHKGVGIFARGCNIDLFIAVGDNARYMSEGAQGGKARVLWFETKDELYPLLDELVKQGDVVLAKGSRGMKMEDIVERVLEL
ncbi:MAG: UDP-N-acetylmuramoyl-tripeptide--D-alanyl-D-alanine ligase [Eubacterium sp.]|nr:UDP-N-acetylmuramoyl-tripeptide--D-alanyl-D-alanine ligase [Candidatus Colimonas fimequi]